MCGSVPKRWLGFLLSGLFLLALCRSAGAASATIDITQYAPDFGGADIQANYTVDDDSCCDAGDIRWLQMVSLTNFSTGKPAIISGYPNTPFIDPQMSQPGGPFDDQPWYDFTYPTANDRMNNTNIGGGAGAYFNDSPSTWHDDGPLQFQAYTILVCIGENEMATFLGGFTWGFTVQRDGTTRTVPLAPLTQSTKLINMFNNGKGGLNASYGWNLVANSDPDCCGVDVTQNGKAIVPLPASVTAGAVLCIMIAVPAVRRRAA